MTIIEGQKHLVKLVLIVCALIPCRPLAAQGWSNGYAFRRTITIDHTQVPNADQVNFPVLVSGTFSDLATTTNGGAVTNANGYDILFTSDASGTDPLPFEQESYNAATGAMIYWVQIPAVSHTTNTTFYLFYGNSTITTDQTNKTGVWDPNYAAVWHLPNGASLNANDSTSNANNGTISSATATTGQIDGAGSFSGYWQYVDAGDGSSLQITGNTITIDAWINTLESSPSAYERILVKEIPSNSSPYLSYGFYRNGSTNQVTFGISSGGTLYSVVSAHSLSMGLWTHVVGTYDGSNLRIYFNGVLDNTAAASGNINTSTQDVVIGADTAAGMEFFNGKVDEVRISNSVRSSDWITTEYNNQKYPLAFAEVGSGAPGPNSPFITTVTPSTVYQGDVVTIQGAGFGATQGGNSASFGGVSVTPQTWSDTAIVLAVPYGITSGSFLVTVSGQTLVSPVITVRSLPSPWLDQDLGAVSQPGSAQYLNGEFTLKASGNYIYFNADSGHVAYQPLNGDGTIVARVVSLAGGGQYQEAGVLIRETLDPGAANVYMAWGAGRPYLAWRSTTNGSSSAQTAANVPLPYWVKLVRSGNVFTGYASLDGIDWQLVSSQTITMAQNAFIALATSAEDSNTALGTAVLDNVSVSMSLAPAITSVSATTGPVGTQIAITGSRFGTVQSGSVVVLNDLPLTINSWSDSLINVTIPSGATSGPLEVLLAPGMNSSNAVEFTITSNPLPSGWLDADVGAVGLTGSATYTNGTFAINASGTDIWGTSDAFHFVYQPLSGDGTIVAQVVTQPNVGSNPKTGVMIRESLDPASTYVHTLYQPGNVAFQERTSTGASASEVLHLSASLPYWVKLVRSGNNFSGYMSIDGVNWVQLGSTQIVDMAQNVYVGLTTDSNNNSYLGTATLDNVSLSSVTSPAPTISGIAPLGGAVGSQVTISGANFGATQGGSGVLLNASPVIVNSWSSTSITITVPSGATSGNLVVSVAPSMDNSNPVQFTVASILLPSTWLDQDIGNVGTAGVASFSNSVFTVKGAGNGIGVGQVGDGFHLVFQPLTGDGSIRARLLSVQGNEYATTAGVMISETLSSDAAFAFTGYVGQGACFWYRASAAATANDNCGGNGGSLPFWLALSRSGNTFTSLVSQDGFNWTVIGTETIPMPQTVYIGLAVTNANTSLLATATFDGVSVSSISNPVPVITSVSATTASVGTQVTISGTDFGTAQNGSVVALNDVPMTINFWNDTLITFTVSPGATTGLLMVSLAPAMNNSNPVEFEVTTQPLPTAWLDQDIGPVGTTGAATYGNSVFTVQGAGNGIGSNGATSDGFHFAYQPLTGDGSITARVISMQGTTTSGQAGVMIRETLNPDSTFAYTGMNPYSQAGCFLYRSATGASTNSSCPAGGPLPYWVRLTRSGNTFTSFVSPNGLNWIQIGTQTITMAETVYIGLAASNADITPVLTATFDGVSVSSTSYPAPVITGASATTGAVGSSVVITGSGFGASSEGGSAVILNDVPVTINSWSDTSISITIPAGATSGNLEVSVAPLMNDSNPVVFTVTSQPLPSGWLDADVGTISAPGSATYASGTFTINSSGSGMAGTADGLHFVYQPLVGDGFLVAEVTGLTGQTSAISEVGVMIRETLDAGATNAFAYFITYSAGAEFSVRTTTGGSTTTQGQPFGNPSYPYWVKIARTGNLFEAYVSQDGSNWTPIGTGQTINMTQTAYIGLAVGNPPSSATVTATISTASITLGTMPIVSGISPGSGGVGTPVTITGLNFGSSQGTSSVSFGGVPVTSILSWSDNQIVVDVPSSGNSGPQPVTVAVNSVGSNNNVSFTLYNPVVTSVSPSTAGPGGVITVHGSGFGAMFTNLYVTSQVIFNGISTDNISNWSDTSITAVVPSNATSGPLTVMQGGVVSNGVQFNVEPLSVTGVSPSSGPAGSLVTISGTGFGSSQSNSTVDFAGTIAAVQSWSDTQIVAIVPPDAASGTVDVNVASLYWFGPNFTMTTTTQVTDSKGNVSSYSSALIGGAWISTVGQGSGCSTCTQRGNISYTYDSSGRVLSRTDENGNTTTYTYDANGNVATVTVPISSGHTAMTTFTYNSFGEVLTAIDPLGFVTTNTYDANGNLLSVTTPLPGNGASASTTRFAYNSLGELTSITDPLGNSTSLTYTPAGLVQTITDAQSNVTTYAYDSRGNRTSVTDANNKQTVFTYDAMSRLTQITYPDSTTTQFGYDYRGRRTSVTDQNGKTTSYGYDDADRLITVTDAANNVTTYGYDTESNLTSIQDANQNTTYFAYDAYGRVIQTTFPSGAIETYGYDNVGNLTGKTDRKNQLITYTYDQLNRLTQKSYPDTSTVNYTYDDDSRLTQVTDPTGTYQFTFDNMGRLTGTSSQYAFLTSRTFATNYAYDGASNRVGFTDPEGGSTSYVYDSLNRLQTLTPPSAYTNGAAANSFGFGYDALSRRTSLTRPNGVNTSYGYDNLSHLLSVTHALAGVTLDGASYGLDNAGNRTAKSDLYAGVTTNYGYDAIYELLNASQSGASTESYTYDPVGNRLSNLSGSAWSYNTSNELNSRPGASYTYDANGNTTSKTDSTGTTTYSWDFENRLTSVTLPGSGGTVSYAYDPFGRRIKKVSSAGTSVFVYDADNLTEEVNSSGAVVARYSDGANVDEPLAVLRSGTTSYFEADGLGSVTSLSNVAGSLANTYTYDSFGNLVASTGTLVNGFRYTAREFDSETSLYYYRARYYDSAAGRFLSEDPIGLGGGDLNFYAYVGGMATSRVDPSGRQMICPFFNPGCIQQQHLSDCAKKVLQPYFPGLNLDSVVISPGMPGFTALTPGFEPGAITLNGTIFYQQGFFSGDAVGLSALGHEITHVGQEGSGFLPPNYLQDYFKNLANGMNPLDAYQNTGAEKAANAMENTIFSDLFGKYGPGTQICKDYKCESK
jgi:RHS repeat-associated protein